jgi:hypothetical protein
MKTDRKRECTDHCSQRDRNDHERGIPLDDALDFEGCHAGVVHGSYAAGDDGTAEPWPVAPLRRERHREPGASEQDCRDQRHHG